MNNILLYMGIAFLFGISNKLADLMNEHGLFWAKGFNIFWGVTWGISASYLVFSSPILAVNYLSLTLYWFLMLKLDYTNHAIAGVMIIISGLYKLPKEAEYFFEIISLTALYYILGLLNNFLKGRNLRLDKFLRLRLKIYLVPLLFSIYSNNYLPFWVTLSGMCGVEMITYIYKQRGLN